MEILKPHISSNRYSIQIYTSNKGPPTQFSLPVLINSPLRVSAHFDRSARRRKSHLRKKLIEQHVRTINHHIHPSLPNFEISNPQSHTKDDKIDETENFPTEPSLFNLNEMQMEPNSSVANSSGTFSGKFGFVSRVGVSVFCGFLMFLAFNNFFRNQKGDDDKEENSSLEKEMLRRKIKARNRMAKENSVVEVIQDSKEPQVFKGRPQLDKEELMVKVKALDDGKIQEIRAMARHARKIESNGEGIDTEPDGSLDVPPPQTDVSSGLGIQGVGNSSDVLGLDVPNINDIVAQGKGSNSFDTEKLVETKSVRVKSSIISSGKEATEYFHKKEKKQEPQSNSLHEVPKRASNEDVGNSSDVLGLDVPNNNDIVAQGKGSNSFDTEKLFETKSVKAKSSIISSVKEAREYLHKKEKKQEPQSNSLHEVPKRASNEDVFGNRTPQSWKNTSVGGNGDVLINNNSKDEHDKGSDVDLGRAKREKWMEDNFHELEPLVEKIRGGFRNNYMVAREKVKEDVNLVLELERDEDESELEWMKDEKLREIVFQVRENELMGRDPFYLMDTQDKALFFKGLEKKVENINEKLGHLHEYLHSNIENLDYGADGISLYDSPEKIIPRWKGPPPTTTVSQEFLDDYIDQRKALFAETLGNMELDSQNMLQNRNEKVETKNLKGSKTVIEGSDGSVKPGKKSGKEFWQHTKKWSRGFIDSYNAESDPETKAAMKDIGKDLDRWITEKEIQDAADIMDKVPDKGKKFIAEKINKLKREMELFGPQAVVSKYSEYGDEEEIDYYWWLDLPFLLCIEMYIDGDGDDRIGFYSLEMASDLELDPKPHHIIAFEDAGDCKNFCYVIQTHMEMLGNGNAFVVPQLPKDTYQEAKANGFNVTVIRKGELKLDVDQTLEEVEEKIVEIGSKMYHDKIMKSHNVDVDSVMKGVFGLKKSSKRGQPNDAPKVPN
ncbi:hypothetical protein SSX86_019152 [Deinandra increscens subsp. villosa]|uniref:Uncharacterized protein n=1 Tax=Deinandra increscens subsp. villosa TaxID=3103831 RepID=A0AAP0CWL1_9ASTR